MTYGLKLWQKVALGAGLAASIVGYCGRKEPLPPITEPPGVSHAIVPDYREVVPDVRYARRPELSHRYSVNGRVQRTKRWDSLIDAVEDRYNMPEGLLAGVVMEESCGDPVQPNATGDGGLGLVHFQPPTARQYGLRVYGSTNGRSRDPRNGRAIRELIEHCEGSVPCIAERDDRAHLLRNLDAAARLVVAGKRRHGSWDLGVRTINWYGPNYVGRVKKWQREYNSSSRNRRAEEAFESLNHGLDYDTWINNSTDRMPNWGLREYIATTQRAERRR